MTNNPTPICNEHHVKKEWCPTTFEYSEQDVTIRVPNVYAWVCPESGEASFTPETVDELVTTVRELIELAKCARKCHPVLTEYTVSVGV
ncbi:MAG: YgiT-type zinc finger protein [Proteobacteria bacterium]|nr:YgiT-type zinc finger protein [Pseudomonadota bacterium]